MSLPQLFKPGQDLGRFLDQVYRVLMLRLYGQGDDMQRVVTFQDLVDLGLVTKAQAQSQAQK